MTQNTSKIIPINLDANASSPALSSAKSVLFSVLSMQGNASSPHILGRRLRNEIDQARDLIARALGGNEKEVFFCSGASEGNRWLVDSLVQTGEERSKTFKVLVSPLEHPSLMKCLQKRAAEKKIDLEVMRIEGGQLLPVPQQLEQAEVVFVTAAHNETGYLPDFDKLLKLLPDEAIVLCDAAQAVGRLAPLPKRVDGIVASAHKMGGVVGAGAVLLRGQARKLSAPWTGGGQEAGLRPGSESVPLIAAMGEAARVIEESRKAQSKMADIRDEIEDELLKVWPFAFVVGGAFGRLSQTSAICLDGVNGDALRIAIDQSGVCVGFGSACSALAPEPSPALLAFGLSPLQARATIRISLSPDMPKDEIWQAIERLQGAVAPLLSGLTI